MDSTSRSELTRALVTVASGRAEADTVIQGGQWLSVQSGEILLGIDVAIKGERIAYVGEDAQHTIGPKTNVIEAKGRYLVPGLLDGHMHVESGMVTVTQFVRAVLLHGTTGMFIDPHEVANVFGLMGIRLMVDEAAIQPIHVWVQVPCCVPSAPGLETPGATIGPEDVAEAMGWPGVIGLGEMMNFPGVAAGDEKMHAEMAEAWLSGKVIGGHYASPDLGLPFHAYVAGGPQDDHEGTRMEDAVARARQGMKVMLRYGSAWHDVVEQIRAVTELGLDPRNFILVTDDSHSGTLVSEGHVDRAVRQAIGAGVDPLVAIQMATINTAEHFGVSRDVGMIAPGRYADILLVDDLEALSIDAVIAKGVKVVENGAHQHPAPEFAYPDEVKSSVRLAHSLKGRDFVIAADGGADQLANVIGVIENQAPTRRLRLPLKILDGQAVADMERDLAKVALVERHRGTGEIQLGFVRGFGLKTACALATTVAHDSHHMIVVGTDDQDMALAANELARVGGGQVVVRQGQTRMLVELPIAGLMSDRSAEEVAGQLEAMLREYRACGCTLNNANMQLSLLALVVIPEMRISDMGLVDVERLKVISLWEED